MRGFGLFLMAASMCLAGAPAADWVATQPLRFEQNRGQADSRFRFIARGPGYRIGVSGDGFTFSGSNAAAKGTRMRLVASNPAAAPEGVEPLDAFSNYFVGAEKREWRTDVPNFRRVKLAGVYPGIDLVVYGKAGALEYDLVVGPGADPAQIEFAIDGARKVRLDEGGALVVETEAGSVRWRRPVLYQDDGGRVDGSFELRSQKRVKFRVGSYDRRKTLVIDPVLDYASYFGGSGNEWTRQMGVDAAGNVYIAGISSSQNLKVTANTLQTFYAGETANHLTGDAFVAKFSPAGALLWSTYIGGRRDDLIFGMAVDAAGNVFGAGFTNSPDFPVTTGVVQPNYKGGGGNACNPLGDGFVFKLNPGGNQLVYSTYLGGTADDVATAVAIDSAGNAYVVGATLSLDFPATAGVVQPAFSGKGGQVGRPNCNDQPAYNTGDAFVAKLNPAGTQLIWSTYLGGKLDDIAMVVGVDGSQNVYVAGNTLSRDFPTKNPVQAAYGGADTQNYFLNYGDGFVTKLNSSGTAIMYSTYLGGAGDELILGMVVDAAGNATMTGSTSSQNFPVTAKAVQSRFGGYYTLPFSVEQNLGDAFVTRLSPTGTLLYSTYLGGNQNEIGASVAVDAAGLIYVAGSTDSPNFPVTAGNFQKSLGGDGGFGNYYPLGDGFLAIIDPNSTSLVYGTYFGGSMDDWFSAVALDPAGNVWVAGGTLSTDLKVTANAAQKTYGGDRPSIGQRGDSMLVHISGLGAPTPLTITDVSQSASPGANPMRGDTFRYAIQVSNTTGAAVTSVKLVDANDGRPEMALSDPVSFDAGSLANGGSYAATVQATGSAAGIYTNTATVTWVDGSARAASARATATTQVDPLPGDIALRWTPPIAVGSGVAQVLADGQRIFVANNPGDSITILTCTSGACKATSTVTLGAGSGPVGLAKLDLDGDGQNDIVVLNQKAGSISVLLSTKGFAASKASPASAGGIGIAPFDAGDRVKRVAVAYTGSIVIYAWDGQSFQPGASVDAGGASSAIVNGDFNGDGIADLVVTDQAAGTAQLYLGDGSGGLYLATVTAVGSAPAAIAVADLDNTGSLDAVIPTGDGMIVLLNDGSGNFNVVTVDPFSGGGSLVIRDFDLDGYLDVAVASATGGSVALYRGDGSGSMSPAGAYLVGNLPVSLTTIDLNANGLPAVVAGASGTKDLTILQIPK